MSSKKLIGHPTALAPSMSLPSATMLRGLLLG